MQCGAAGIALIKSFEGCKLCAYQDQGGVWSIGYGQTGPFVTEGLTIQQDQADAWLHQSVDTVAAGLSRMIKMVLNQNEFDALCAWAYNVGLGNASSSSVIALVNQGHLELVPSHLAQWNKITVNGQKVADAGLTRRRAAEIALYNTPMQGTA